MPRVARSRGPAALSRLIPPPRVHRHRYHGVLAPNAHLRERVVTLVRDDAPAPGGIASIPTASLTPPILPETPPPPTSRTPRNASPPAPLGSFLARIYEVFPLTCPGCGADMRILAFITAAEPVDAILTHLGLPTTAPPLSPRADRLNTISPSTPIPASASTRRPPTIRPNPNPSRTSTSIRAPAPEAQPRPPTRAGAHVRRSRSGFPPRPPPAGIQDPTRYRLVPGDPPPPVSAPPPESPPRQLHLAGDSRNGVWNSYPRLEFLSPPSPRRPIRSASASHGGQPAVLGDKILPRILPGCAVAGLKKPLHGDREWVHRPACVVARESGGLLPRITPGSGGTMVMVWVGARKNRPRVRSISPGAAGTDTACPPPGEPMRRIANHFARLGRVLITTPLHRRPCSSTTRGFAGRGGHHFRLRQWPAGTSAGALVVEVTAPDIPLALVFNVAVQDDVAKGSIIRGMPQGDPHATSANRPSRVPIPSP
jgi:hypothetical protein